VTDGQWEDARGLRLDTRPSRAPLTGTAPAAASLDPNWGLLALRDPGSTGGLLDSLASSGTLPDIPAFRDGSASTVAPPGEEPSFAVLHSATLSEGGTPA
jgi:hypothetical protein